MRYQLALLLIITSALACGGKKEDTAECKSMRADVVAQGTFHKEQVEATRAALTAALVALPVASNDPCSAKDLNWQKFTAISGGSLEGVHIPEPFYLGTYESDVNESFCSGRGKDNIKGKHKLFRDEVARVKSGHMLHFIDAERVSPELLDGKSFKGGHVRGWLLVWSYAAQKFICTAEAQAESGKTLHTTTGGVRSSQDLDDHLTSVVVRRAIENLRQIDDDAKPVPFAEAVAKGDAAGGAEASGLDSESMAKIHGHLRDGKKILAIKEHRTAHKVPLSVSALFVEVEAAKIGLPSRETVRNLYWAGKSDEAIAELQKLYKGQSADECAELVAAMDTELGPATEENLKAKLAANDSLAVLRIYHHLHPELSIAKAHEAVTALKAK